MADIEQIDATQGAGEPLYLGFAKANQVITKINAIEAGATADQSGAEIKALLEALVDKLSIAAVKETDTKKILTAAERTSLAANIAKLAGIDADAKDDQTGAEIKALLEALADKLSIETGVKETAAKKVLTSAERTSIAANVVDVAAAQADIDGFPDELKNLIAHEIQQLETLGAVTTISAAQWGYIGVLTTHPLGADGTAGRIPRGGYLLVANGTVGVSLKCTVDSRWNGDTIAETDDVAKGATTGHFTLSASGEALTIETAGLTGNVLYAHGSIYRNQSTVDLTILVIASGNDIVIYLYNTATGVLQDITTLADTGTLAIEIFYITDA